ncbi:MAG TPA: ester cyclase [Anaerolineales bacterium]|nr:ester cyclase [Anaerolineales bacterium]
MSERNKAAIRRFYEELVNERKIELADEMIWQDVDDHAARVAGLENFKKLYAVMLRIFPDIQARIEDLIAEEDKVVARVEFTATQAGSFRGFPPANRCVTFSGMDIFRFQGGKIAERWAQRDFLGMLEKLGHVTKR